MIAGHIGPVFDAVFSPGGKLIVSVGQDATAQIYPLSACETCGSIDELLRLARSRVTHSPTPAERQEFGAG